MSEYRTQVLKWFAETGYVDGNGIGLWDGTKESVEVTTRQEAEAIRDQWLSEGKLIRNQWGLRPPYPYGDFRIRCEWHDASDAFSAALARADAAEAARDRLQDAQVGLRGQISKLLGILDEWDKARAEDDNGLTMHTYGSTPDWYVEAAFWSCYGRSPYDESNPEVLNLEGGEK